MAKISHIIRSAVQDIGMTIAEGETVPGDIYKPMFELLGEVVSQLNTQAGLSFSQGMLDTTVSGDRLTFSNTPGVDTITSVIPIIAPDVITSNSVKLRIVTLTDLYSIPVQVDLEAFAFNRLETESVLYFNRPLNGESIKIIYRAPITIDAAPYGDVQIPNEYVPFLVAKLAEAGAVRFQWHETADAMARKANANAGLLVNNNMSRQPIRHDVYASLNKFRRR